MKTETIQLVLKKPKEFESKKDLYKDKTDMELEQIDKEIQEKEKELLEQDKNSPKCYISSQVTSFRTKKTDSQVKSEKKRSIDPTIMKSSESQIQKSLNFEDLNVEEESQFLGKNPSKSKIKDISTDTETSDDDLGISGFNKSILNKNSDSLEEKKKKAESSFIPKKSKND